MRNPKNIKKNTTITYNYTAIRMAKIRNPNNIKCGKDIEKMEPSIIAGGNIKWEKSVFLK